MTVPMVNDVDYLAGRLHARRSRMAEGGRLDVLCSLPGVDDLLRTIYLFNTPPSVEEFQRRRVGDLVQELAGYAPHLAGAGGRLFAWLLVRFQVENLKVLLRGVMTATPLATLQIHLLSLPAGLEADASSLASAGSPGDFAARLPKGPLRASLQKAVVTYHEQPRSFFFEAALDRGYHGEALARAEALENADQEEIRPLVQQEVDIFHLMLVARGRFVYDLPPAQLLPLHVRGTRISRGRFAAMLADPDLQTAAGRVFGCVVETAPPVRGETVSTAADLETAAWTRFLYLANHAFRCSHIGLGVVIGYTGLRRVETANLITLSEGLRATREGARIRERLIPRITVESSHV